MCKKMQFRGSGEIWGWDYSYNILSKRSIWYSYKKNVYWKPDFTLPWSFLMAKLNGRIQTH